MFLWFPKCGDPSKLVNLFQSHYAGIKMNKRCWNLNLPSIEFVNEFKGDLKSLISLASESHNIGEDLLRPNSLLCFKWIWWCGLSFTLPQLVQGPFYTLGDVRDGRSLREEGQSYCDWGLWEWSVSTALRTKPFLSVVANIPYLIPSRDLHSL